MKRKLRLCALIGVSLGVLAILGPCAMIRLAARGRTYSDLGALPHRQVGVLLGCSQRLADGRDNLFFAYRIRAATQLFHGGKVDYLLVSGDNHVAGYDEPSDMKQALVAGGIPAERVYCDYAGFRTLDSIVRAREVFGQTCITLVSQEFHNQRAIFIARHRGVDAIGYNAPEVNAYNGLRTQLREHLARAKTVLDVYVLGTRPHFGGPRIAIGPPPPPPANGADTTRPAPET